VLNEAWLWEERPLRTDELSVGGAALVLACIFISPAPCSRAIAVAGYRLTGGTFAGT